MSRAIVTEWIDARIPELSEANQKVWEFAEVGLHEHRSAALLSEMLESYGFTVRRGVAGMPTAFVAKYGAGAPVVGILGEYDALPGLSQEATPRRHGAGCQDDGADRARRAERRGPGSPRLRGTAQDDARNAVPLRYPGGRAAAAGSV